MQKSWKALVLMMAVAALVGCAELFADANPQEFDKAQDISTKIETLSNLTSKNTFETESRTILTTYGRFIEAQGGKVVKGPDKRVITPNIEKYIKAGVELSNKACREWFVAHDKRLTNANFSKGIFDVLGATVIASLGLAEAPATSMGIIAIILGGVDAGYGHFKANFLLTDTLGKLEMKLIVNREELAVNLKKNAGKYDLSEAQGELLRYHDNCSRRQVVQYIKDSVDLAEFKVGKVEPQSFLELAKKATFPAQLYKLVFNDSGGFPVQTLRDLYRVKFTGIDNAKKDKILDANPFQKQIDEKLTALKDAAPNSPDRKRYDDFLVKFNEYALLMKFSEDFENQAIEDKVKAKTIQSNEEKDAAKSIKIEGTGEQAGATMETVEVKLDTAKDTDKNDEIIIKVPKLLLKVDIPKDLKKLIDPLEKSPEKEVALEAVKKAEKATKFADEAPTANKQEASVKALKLIREAIETVQEKVKKVPLAQAILEMVIRKAEKVNASVKNLTPNDQDSEAQKKIAQAAAKIEDAKEKTKEAEEKVRTIAKKLELDIKRLRATGKLLPTTSVLVPKQQ